MQFRPAQQSDLDSIYKMGFDAWAEGQDLESYLEVCRNSSKYKKGQWWVLQNQGELVCSLITYKLADSCIGIGSIATPIELRRKGFAGIAIESIMSEMKWAEAFFLYSDIHPRFYEKFGFRKLPDPFQSYPNTACMVRTVDFESLILKSDFAVPKYF